jgi:hypothetical protein
MCVTVLLSKQGVCRISGKAQVQTDPGPQACRVQRPGRVRCAAVELSSMLVTFALLRAVGRFWGYAWDLPTQMLPAGRSCSCF